MKFPSAVPFALAGALLLVLSTLWMVPEPAPRLTLRALLVDVSASATRPSLVHVNRVREELDREARAASEAGQQLLVVLAGAEVQRLFGPEQPERLRELLRGVGGPVLNPMPAGELGTRSELARGVRLVRELIESAGATEASLLTIGDGSFTGEDPAPLIEQLIARGVEWRGNHALAPDSTEVALAELRAPRELESGAPLAATVRVVVREGRLGERIVDQVTVRATDDAGVRFRTAELGAIYDELERSPELETRVADFDFDLGPVRAGETQLEARLRSTSGTGVLDSIPENDVARRVVLSGEPLVVGWCADPALEPLLRARVAALPSGFSSRFLAPAELAGALAELDALFVFDRSLEELPASLIESFVQAGGGLFLGAGWNLLSGWASGGEQTRLQELLPLELDPGAPSQRDVIVLVDGSGSMAGAPFERVRAAVRELVRAAPPRDRIQLAFFTRALHGSTTLRGVQTPGHDPTGERERLARELLDARVPGGSTKILDSLEQLAGDRESADNEALVLLLSDGREAIDVDDRIETAAALRERFAASKTELLAFAIGEQADLDFLRLLVERDGDLYSGEAGEDLGELFRREINRDRIRAADAIALNVRTGPLANELLPMGLEPAPLARLVRMLPRPSAEFLFVSDRGEPVLAAQRVGRGRVVQLASLPFGDWAPAWSDRFGELTPALRWCARRSAGEGRLRLERTEAQLILRGLPPLTPPRLVAELRDPRAGSDPRRLEFSLPASAAGVSPADVRSAELPAWLAELEPGTVRLDFQDAAGERLFSLPLSTERAPEFVEPRRFASLPAPSGPGANPALSGRTPSGLATAGEGRGARDPLARILLYAGAILVGVAAWRLSVGSRRQGVEGTDR